MVNQTVVFLVHIERDRDILRWLGSQGSKSAAIRSGIRGHLARGGITLSDVCEAIQDLKRRNWTPGYDAKSCDLVESDSPPRSLLHWTGWVSDRG